MAEKHPGHENPANPPGSPPAPQRETNLPDTVQAIDAAAPTDRQHGREQGDAALREREVQLRAYARLLDSAVRLPGGFRVGLDGLVGLIPGVGDLIGAGLSGYLVVAAARLGLPRSVIARMVANVALETVVGAVPLLGDAFDLVFKANERNVRLLQLALEQREAERMRQENVPTPPDSTP